MSAAHTPGPWTYEVTNGSDLLVMAGDECVVSGCGCCGSPNCEEADARLIAAAPDLLYSLRAFVDHGTCFSEDDMSAARAAIAKATGEAA